MELHLDVSDALRKFESLGDLGKYGLYPENRSVGGYLRGARAVKVGDRSEKGHTISDWKKHQGPDGRPWAKKYAPPPPAVGQTGPVDEHGGKLVFAEIVSPRQARRAARILKRKKLLAKKGLAAMYRPRGENYGPNRKAKKLFEILARHREVARPYRDGVVYGLNTAQSRWAARLHFGGTYRGKPVPPRPMLGVTPRDVEVINRIYLHGYFRRLEKKLAIGRAA